MKLPNFFKKILSLPFGRERGQWFFEQLRKISFERIELDAVLYSMEAVKALPFNALFR